MRADGAVHGTGHEQLLEGGYSSLHGTIFVEQSSISLLKMTDVLRSFA